MIYIPSDPNAEYTLAFPNLFGTAPRDEWEGDEPYLELINDMLDAGFESDFHLDDVTPGWFVVTIRNGGQRPPFPDGEYTYKLRRDGADSEVMSQGLCIVGSYTVERQQYDKPIEYEQYD